MTAPALTLIDDRVVVNCTVEEALHVLDGPDQIACWFTAARTGTSTMIRSHRGTCVLAPNYERWNQTDQVLTVDGRIGDVAVHAYLTLRAVVHSIFDGHLQHGTEIWVHAELGPGRHTRRAAHIITSAISDGLEHLRLELDRSPDVR